jgi:hypothetical protein
VSLREQEPLVVGGLVGLLLVLWLPFPFHAAPRFAGSPVGGALGVAAAILMVVPLAYSVVKRVPALKRRLSRRVPLRTLLTWHIYAGIFGPILGVLHSGHDYESPLGVGLVAMTLVVVLSGFAGRYLLGRLTRAAMAQKGELVKLRQRYEETLSEIHQAGRTGGQLRPLSSLFGRLALSALAALDPTVRGLPELAAVRQAEAVVDLEAAVQAQEGVRRLFRAWLNVHLALSAVLYALLALHVWAAFHFGVRWLR